MPNAERPQFPLELFLSRTKETRGIELERFGAPYSWIMMHNVIQAEDGSLKFQLRQQSNLGSSGTSRHGLHLLVPNVRLSRVPQVKSPFEVKSW